MRRSRNPDHPGSAAVSANDADNRPFEAAQVLLERGEDVPADTANGRNTRAGWTAVRKGVLRTFAAIAAGVTPPASPSLP